MTTFQDLGLAEPLLKALSDEGYATPTPIQKQAIPPVMTGTDLLGIAQTGTGKTAAFALPILHRLLADKKQPPRQGCRVLILSPTRELATQIGDSFRTYGRHTGLSVTVVFGGVAHRPQIMATRNGIDVLVATPGRLLDHIAERNIDIRDTEILVLDEADQMLDLGFVKPIRRIVSYLSKERQNLFFSATMPTEIGALAGELLRNPQKVSVAPVATTAERVSQRVIHVRAAMKRGVLVELLGDAAMSRTLVFTRTKRGADKVARHLDAAGISAAAIHGNKSQRQREEALEAFRQGKTRVLVATDIAARGIDIDSVSHVVNYELPDVPEAYVHRIGRTARAGAEGVAISLCDGEERGNLRDIERLTRQTIPSETREYDAALVAASGAEEPRRPRQPQRRGGGDRPSHGQREGRSDRHPRGDRRPQGGDHRQARHAQADRLANHDRPWSNDGRDDARSEAPRDARPERSASRDRPQSERPRPYGDRPRSNGDRSHGDRPQRSGEHREHRAFGGEHRRPHGDRPAPRRDEGRSRPPVQVEDGFGGGDRAPRGGDRPRPQSGERRFSTMNQDRRDHGRGRDGDRPREARPDDRRPHRADGGGQRPERRGRDFDRRPGNRA